MPLPNQPVSIFEAIVPVEETVVRPTRLGGNPHGAHLSPKGMPRASIGPLRLTSQRQERGVTAEKALSSGEAMPASRRVAHRHGDNAQQRGHPL
jgi:hypothetical protein